MTLRRGHGYQSHTFFLGQTVEKSWPGQDFYSWQRRKIRGQCKDKSVTTINNICRWRMTPYKKVGKTGGNYNIFSITNKFEMMIFIPHMLSKVSLCTKKVHWFVRKIKLFWGLKENVFFLINWLLTDCKLQINMLIFCKFSQRFFLTLRSNNLSYEKLSELKNK